MSTQLYVRNSKNLFDISKIPTKGTVTNNGDGTLTLSVYSNNAYATLLDCCPELQSGKEYWININSPASFARQIYLYGANIAWAFDTKKTITDEMLDSIVVLYGYHLSEPQFGQPCVISNIIISETNASYVPYNHMSKIKPMIIKRNPANLLPFPSDVYYNGYKVTADGITYTVQSDGGIHIEGTIGERGYSYHHLYRLPIAGVGVCSLACYCDDSNVKFCVDDINNKRFKANKNNHVKTDGADIKQMLILLETGKTFNTVVYPMLNKGETAESYYIGDKIKHQLVTRNTANLIPFPYAEQSKTINGITYTINTDGSVTLNGTATASALLKLYVGNLSLPTGQYCLHGMPLSVTRFSVVLAIGFQGGIYKSDFGGGITFTVDKPIQIIYITAYAGYTFDNTTIYPMLNKGETAEPYFSNL